MRSLFSCGLVLLAALLPRLSCAADVAFWDPYDEASYLFKWSDQTFNVTRGAPNGFPGDWWLSNVTPCPPPGEEGLQHVECGAADASGVRFVTGIDLSREAVPPNVARIRGQMKSPPFIVGLRFLTSLNMSGQLLRGALPPMLALVPRLARLDVAGNELYGVIPPELCRLNLTAPGGCVNLANNNFRGPIPSCFADSPCVDFQGNSRLQRVVASDGAYLDCNPSKTIPSCWPQLLAIQAPPPPPQPQSWVALPVWAIALIVLASVLLVCGLAAGVVLCLKQRRKARVAEERQQLMERIETELDVRRYGVLHRYSSEELGEACKGFSDDHYVGEGAFSRVYKGILADGTVVAVKRVKTESAKAEAAIAFIREVEIISRAAHRDLAQCLGFCVDVTTSETPQLMLAMRFYPNGSVAGRTRGREGAPLDWLARQRIAQGSAEGIAYLHRDCDPPIIHRDIKAENILLDEKDSPAVADFGLALELDSGETNRIVSIQGTLGHIAPEYFMSGRCSAKTDVYAFGVFLLELISGKDSFAVAASAGIKDDQIVLHDWLQELVDSGKVAMVVDSELQGSLEPEEVASMLKVAALCVCCDPAERPTMDQVCSMLSGDLGLKGEQRWHEDRGEEAAGLADLMLGEGDTTTGVFLDPSTLQGRGR